MYSNTISVDSTGNLEAYIVTSIVVCIGMYWFVLVYLSTYMLVLDHKLIVNLPIWCLHLNPLLMQYLLLTLQKWVCVCIFSPHCYSMVRGKDHGSFQSQIKPLCHIHPQDSTYPSCLACSVLCWMVPVSPAGISGRRPKKLDNGAIQTGLRQVQHLTIVALDHQHSLQGGSRPTTARFFWVSSSMTGTTEVSVIEQSQSTNRWKPNGPFAHAPSCWTEKPKTDTYPILTIPANTYLLAPIKYKWIHTNTYTLCCSPDSSLSGNHGQNIAWKVVQKRVFLKWSHRPALSEQREFELC